MQIKNPFFSWIRLTKEGDYSLADDRKIRLVKGMILSLRETGPKFQVAYSPSGQFVWIDRESCELVG
jgi:hypothetical protein